MKTVILDLSTAEGWLSIPGYVKVDVPDGIHTRVKLALKALHELEANAIDFYWYANFQLCDEGGHKETITNRFGDDISDSIISGCNLHVSRDGDFCFILPLQGDEGGECLTQWLSLEDLDKMEAVNANN